MILVIDGVNDRVLSECDTKMKVHCILPVTIRKRFFTSTDHRGFKFGLVRMYVTPCRIFWIIFTSDLIIGYTDELLVFVANLSLFCYERDFMTSLSDDNQADIIEAFNSTQPLDI